MGKTSSAIAGVLGTTLTAGAMLVSHAVAAENPAAELELPSVVVVGTTPLPGIGVPIDQVPSNVQLLTGAGLSEPGGANVTEALERQGNSVHLGQGQGNPYQPDLHFRGFTASPLVGTPQGISVFVDGVRVNESFGDIVNWDLLPASAISSVQMLPGSNAVFGMNTLGGAMVVNTKSGFKYPGFTAEALTGSYGRRQEEFAWGGHDDDVDYFITAHGARDDGWRQHAASDVNQLFAKIGRETGTSDLDLSIMAADNTLNGGQALPQSMQDNPRQAYTWPDTTTNRLGFANLRGSVVLAADRIIAGNLYWRDVETGILSSNVVCDTVGCVPNVSNNRLTIHNTRYGGTVQFTGLADLMKRGNHLAVGVSVDRGRVSFVSETQAALLTPDRGTVGAGPFSVATAMAATQTTMNVFATDTLSLTEKLHLTGSGAYNMAEVDIADRSGANPGLAGTHRFARFNPAVGLSFVPAAKQSYYASYSEGMRAPNPVELTCADPTAPCSLPNIFLADPPLKPVVSHTWELGLRRPLGADGRLTAALFRTQLHDDIQFIGSGGAINAGYFQNVGRTQRQGAEFGIEGRSDAWFMALRYSLIDATFQTPFVGHNPNNSSADAAGDFQVNAGDRIPGVPRHNLKLRAEYAIGATTLGGSVVAYSSQYARGDENNRDDKGPLPGYAVLNLDFRHRIERGWQLFGSVNNIFDRRYSTFGVIGGNLFVANPSIPTGPPTPERFDTPGAPRTFWLGVRYKFSGKDG